MERKKYSLKSRMLLMVTSLILAVFALTFISFNLLISNYIETNATEALTQSRSNLPPDRTEAGPSVRERKPPQSVGGNAERLFVTADRQVLLPDFYPALDESSPLYDFIQHVEDGTVLLDRSDILKLTTDQGLYYYTVVPSAEGIATFQVYFINMTNLYSFEQNLSRLLLLIMSVALVLAVAATYLIASRIAGPVKALSVFARHIGNGDYQTLEEDFADREVHELKLSMNESSEKLRRYDEEQRVFFQNASHELRTPLQIIKTNAEALELDLIPKQKALPVIRQEVDSLSQLVEDVILLSRLDARSRDLVQTTGDLRETLSYTAERFASVLAEQKIQIQYDFQEDPVLFTYDDKSMERALQNLISNAVRYARSSLTLSCREEAGRIVIRVADDGPGISPEDLPHIFDRFYKGAKGNHGIGLSIVRSIVTSYGGRIEVASSPEGAVFTIFLPPLTPSTRSNG